MFKTVLEKISDCPTGSPDFRLAALQRGQTRRRNTGAVTPFFDADTKNRHSAFLSAFGGLGGARVGEKISAQSEAILKGF